VSSLVATLPQKLPSTKHKQQQEKGKQEIKKRGNIIFLAIFTGTQIRKKSAST